MLLYNTDISSLLSHPPSSLPSFLPLIHSVLSFLPSIQTSLLFYSCLGSFCLSFCLFLFISSRIFYLPRSLSLLILILFLSPFTTLVSYIFPFAPPILPAPPSALAKSANVNINSSFALSYRPFLSHSPFMTAQVPTLRYFSIPHSFVK